MSEKQKPARERLILRSGGLLFLAPFVIGFMALLVVVAFMSGFVLFVGTPETGLPSEAVPFLALNLLITVMALLGLTVVTLRYLRGIGKLAQQRHYVKQEEKRIEQLEISQTGISDGMTEEDLVMSAEIETAMQSKVTKQ